MAFHLWAVGDASAEKPQVSTESEAAGYAAGLLTWALAGSVFVAVKMAITEMPPWTFCFWRVLLSALVLVPLVASHHSDMLAFLRKRWPEALFIGAIGLGLTQGVMFTALGHTSAVNVGIIFGITPIVTMVAARFVLHEPMNSWQGLGSVIAFAGIVFIAVHGSLTNLLGLKLELGDIIALGGVVLFAGYTILLKRAKFELPRLPLLVLLLFGGAIATFPFFLIEFVRGEHANLAETGYLALLYTAIPGGALMYLFYNWSVDVLGASRAGALLYTQMIFTAFFAWLIIGEAIEWYHYAGAGLIIIGILFVTLLKPADPASAPK